MLGARAEFTYPEVGATAKLAEGRSEPGLATTYDVDHHRFPLGLGRPLYERACAALIAWRHFEIPWLKLCGGRPVSPGQVVATLLPIAGLWFLNPCRVVYAELQPGADAAAFAYGTLPGHPECGEERFSVIYDPASDRVLYEITVFSRPGRLFSRVGYPFARRLQRSFVAASAAALAEAAT